MFLPLDLVQERVVAVGEPAVAAQLAAGGQRGQVGQEVSPQPLRDVAHSHRLRQRQLGAVVLLVRYSESSFNLWKESFGIFANQIKLSQPKIGKLSLTLS